MNDCPSEPRHSEETGSFPTREYVSSPEFEKLGEIVGGAVLRGIARDLILRGEVDSTAITLKQLQVQALAELRSNLEANTVGLEMVVDHSESILSDARAHVEGRRFEYAFVFYSLYVEHLLNRAIRDRATQLTLNERETTDLMKKSIHEKTGLSWKLLFGQEMPRSLSEDIRALAQRRNSFIHYKWKPEPTQHMLHDEIQSTLDHSVAQAERAVTSLRPYVEELFVDPTNEIYAWITSMPAMPQTDGDDDE